MATFTIIKVSRGNFTVFEYLQKKKIQFIISFYYCLRVKSGLFRFLAKLGVLWKKVQ